MAEINWGLIQDNPIQQQAKAFSYADQVAQNAAKFQAGGQYAAGDYAGAAKTAAQSGDIQGAQQIDQQGQKSAEAVHQYISQALPVFQHIMQVHANDPDGGKQAVGQAFDSVAPEISQLTGHNDQAIAQIRQNLISDPQGFINRVQSMIPVKYSTVAPGGTMLRQQGNAAPEPVYTAPPKAPDGFKNLDDGSQTYITGGPGDPAYKKTIAQDRRDIIIQNPIARAGDMAHPDISGSVGEADPTSKSILAQTGLSQSGFMALTGHTAQLPRGPERAAAMREVQDFANKRGIDVSTLQSQYKAYNDTLQKNIERVNQTGIMENELQGTIANLKPIADAAGLGKLNVANVGKILAGQQTNDPVVQQYAQQLNQLRTELAGYNAATQGRAGGAITMQDYTEAERVIKNGLSSKGADGLQKAIESSTGKMTSVLNRSVDDAQRNVWKLFGVGANFDKVHGINQGQNLKAKYGLD